MSKSRRKQYPASVKVAAIADYCSKTMSQKAVGNKYGLFFSHRTTDTQLGTPSPRRGYGAKPSVKTSIINIKECSYAT